MEMYMYNTRTIVIHTRKYVLWEGEGGWKEEFGEKTVMISQPVPSLSVSGGRPIAVERLSPH